MMLYNIPAAQDPNRSKATAHWRLYHGDGELPRVVLIENEDYDGYEQRADLDPDRFIGTWSYGSKQEAATALTVLMADARTLITHPAFLGPQC